MPPTTPTPHPLAPAWTLEVVRGVRVGQRYPLGLGSFVLGSASAALNGETVVCLADQEGASPRKMAARHVAIAPKNGSLHLTDLDAPGGTFVNNRRWLSGTSGPLAEGDILQLGAVQLKLVQIMAGTQAAAPVAPVVASFRYVTSGSGAVCRTWDDFLTLSAQKWDELRADLLAGKLAEFVASVGRPDLAPAAVRGSLPSDEADERLNTWLGRLPTRTAATPELDVHPLRLVVGVPSGGVTVIKKVRVANVGYGLLRVRVRVDSPTGASFRIGNGLDNREFVVRDSAEIPVEINVPDQFTVPGSAQLVITGAGLVQRVAVVVEHRAATPNEPSDIVGPDPTTVPGPLARFRELSVAKRVTIAALIGLASRLLVGVAGGSIGEDVLLGSGPETPHLGGVVLAFAVTGAGLGGWWLARRGGQSDLGVGVGAGAGLGVLLAAAAVALCRVVEPAVGAAPLVAIGFWGLIGGISGLLVPPTVARIEEPAQ